MAFEDCTAAYVNLLSFNKYATRTADAVEFAALKDMYSVYINTNTCAFPAKKQTHGMALLILHHYAMDDTQSPDAGSSDTQSGPIVGEKVGDVSIQYGQAPTYSQEKYWRAWLSLSQWGMQFLYLLRTFKSTPLVT